MGELVREIEAQAVAFALRCAPGFSRHIHVTKVMDPDQPSRMTLIVSEREGDHGELVLVDLDAEHVLEEVQRIEHPDVLAEGVRRAARLIYVGPHLAGPLLEALAHVG